MENVLYVLKCIAFVIVPLVVWGLLASLLESWLEKMVDKGRLPEEYALSTPACAAVIFGLFFLIASVMKKISG